MRIYDVVLFVFIFNLSLGIVANLGTVGAGASSSYVAGSTSESYINSQANSIASIGEAPTAQAVNTQNTFSWFNAAYQFVMLGISKIISIFWDSTIGIYWMLTGTLHVPIVLALPLSLLVYFIYTLGLLQLFTQRSFKEYA